MSSCLGRVSHKGDNFVTSWLLSCTPITFWKGISAKRKEYAPCSLLFVCMSVSKTMRLCLVCSSSVLLSLSWSERPCCVTVAYHRWLSHCTSERRYAFFAFLLFITARKFAVVIVLLTHCIWICQLYKDYTFILYRLALWAKFSADELTIFVFFFFFYRKQVLAFHANCLQWRNKTNITNLLFAELNKKVLKIKPIVNNGKMYLKWVTNIL